jgi:hypothetical protein
LSGSTKINPVSPSWAKSFTSPRRLKDQIGERHRPPAGRPLGFGEDEPLAGELDQLAFHAHGSGVQVEVSPL